MYHIFIDVAFLMFMSENVVEKTYYSLNNSKG